MAIIFELWAECATKEQAELFAQHFDQRQFQLLTERTITWTTQIEGTPTGTFAVVVYSSGLSDYGISSLVEALETTETGLYLYHHLQTAPAFRFARVDWEAENLQMHDLPDFVEIWGNGERYLSLSCVLDEKLYQELGRPVLFKQFREGYWWYPYRGETYRPLHSRDQQSLNRLCGELFPQYFAA